MAEYISTFFTPLLCCGYPLALHRTGATFENTAILQVTRPNPRHDLCKHRAMVFPIQAWCVFSVCGCRPPSAYGACYVSLAFAQTTLTILIAY